MQIPEEEQEQYEKGQHLRGRDAEMADQVCAEMVRLACFVASNPTDKQECMFSDRWFPVQSA